MPKPKGFAFDRPVESWGDAAKVMAEFSDALGKQQKAAAAMATFFSLNAQGGGGATNNEGDGKKKRKKPQVDASKPKRGKSSYLIYCAENMAVFKTENEGIKPTELMKLCGEKWRTLDDEQKAPYVQAANVSKETYLAEMKAWSPGGDVPAVVSSSSSSASSSSSGVAADAGGDNQQTSESQTGDQSDTSESRREKKKKKKDKKKDKKEKKRGDSVSD